MQTVFAVSGQYSIMCAGRQDALYISPG
jgi:hypothetical protein